MHVLSFASGHPPASPQDHALVPHVTHYQRPGNMERQNIAVSFNSYGSVYSVLCSVKCCSVPFSRLYAYYCGANVGSISRAVRRYLTASKISTAVERTEIGLRGDRRWGPRPAFGVGTKRILPRAVGISPVLYIKFRRHRGTSISAWSRLYAASGRKKKRKRDRQKERTKESK